MSEALLQVSDLTIEFIDRGRVSNRPVRGVELEVGRGRGAGHRR